MFTVLDLRRPGLGPVSFTLDAGECVALRGPSGSGKSLLLRALADLDPNEGTVTLAGRSRADMPAPQWRRAVTYVPAEPGWWADTVGAHFRDWNTAEPLAVRLGLPPECRDWPVLRLSTGERQRLGLIRALVNGTAVNGTLVNGPRVLLLDEPTSGLDETATAAVEQVIAEMLTAGAGVLWVSHDAAQVARVARRLLLIENGQVREEAVREIGA